MARRPNFDSPSCASMPRLKVKIGDEQFLVTLIDFKSNGWCATVIDEELNEEGGRFTGIVPLPEPFYQDDIERASVLAVQKLWEKKDGKGQAA